MLTHNDDGSKQQIQEEAGIKPHSPMESCSDLEEDVRQSIRRIQANPFMPNEAGVREFIYESRPDGCAR